MVVFQNQVIGIGSEEQILFVRRSGRLSNRERPKGDNEEYETIDLTIDGDSEDERAGWFILGWFSVGLVQHGAGSTGWFIVVWVKSARVGSAWIWSSVSLVQRELVQRELVHCSFGSAISIDDGNGSKLSYWHGLRDGCVGLLDARLKCGGSLAIQQLCASGIPQTLFDLLGNNHSDQIGLSPVGVVWNVSSLCQCLLGGASTFRQVLLRREHVKLVSDLVSDDVHLKIIMCWSGPGEGKNGVKDTVNAVINLLAFHLWRCKMPNNSVFETCEIKGCCKTGCLSSQMTGHRSLVVQLLGKSLLNPNIMRRLLDNSSPREVILVQKLSMCKARHGFMWCA
ncbi:hypothetical protein CTI12_AA620580 [Artemisia annua]|uniref:non-specific serine/threonine protein kinase n=1 Tax=Artemisia annua TaxID=35608 RepID=A0A2U1KC14_ARTAN|nr:hypothetical protein CTI12_AA620580 [Artemisia annua]